MTGKPSLASMSLENAMLSLFNVSYWPMTEASGNAIDHKSDNDVTWAGGVTRQATTLPNGDKIPAFDGTGLGTMYTTALRDAMPYNAGSLVAVLQVPTTALWEGLTNQYLLNFATDGAEMIYIAKPSVNSLRGYRNSNTAFTICGMVNPVMIGMTWNIATGLMTLFSNGRSVLWPVGGQVAFTQPLSGTYTRIGADTNFGTNKWIGSIGHVGLGSKVLVQSEMTTLFNKIFPSHRKFFIIGDSKSTGANFWPGYFANALQTETGDMWIDAPHRYSFGGYDIGMMQLYVTANLSAETDTPEFILINMGTNDARPVTITGEVAFKASYNSVIASCQAKWPGVPIYCQRIYRSDSETTIANSTTINNYIDDIIASYVTGVYAGPDDEVWAENGDAGATYLGADKVHYSSAANSVLAGLWADIIIPTL